jgi:hypothetical protein
VSEPIFSSVGQALFVSYAIEGEPALQRGTTQVLIESIRQQLGQVERRLASSINAQGMTPLEFRGQCAMVRASAEALPDPEAAVILAVYGKQATMTKPRGVIAFRNYIKPSSGIDNDIALAALCWNVFHRDGRRAERISLRQIEAESGIPKSTLGRVAVSIQDAARRLRVRAEDRLQSRFQAAGLVPSVDSV